jgi:hypothetical protein
MENSQISDRRTVGRACRSPAGSTLPRVKPIAACYPATRTIVPFVSPSRAHASARVGHTHAGRDDNHAT